MPRLSMTHTRSGGSGDVLVDDLLELERAQVGGERLREPAGSALDVGVVRGQAAGAEFLAEHFAGVVEGRAWVHERKGGDEAGAMHAIAGGIRLQAEVGEGKEGKETHSSPILRRGVKEYLLERLLKRASAGPKALKMITGWPRTRILDTSPVRRCPQEQHEQD